MRETLVKPTSSELKKYIQYFFFVENSDPNFQKSYTCYPNTNHCLGLHKGNKISRLSESDYAFVPTDNFHSYLTGIYQKPMRVDYEGAFRGVWINFEPLGLELLAGERLSSEKFIQDVIDVAFPRKWSEIYNLAFEDKNPEDCACLLEDFFLKNLTEKNSFEYSPFNKIYANRVEHLKDTFNLSYSSINRLYQNSLGLSPKTFLNIRRFRRSVEHIFSFDKLTDVAHEEGYSDQSHMIRDFKKYTGHSPKTFRKQGKIFQKQLYCTTE